MSLSKGILSPNVQANLVHKQFELQAENNPNNIAAIMNGEAITYSELNMKANSLANCLKSQNVRAEQPVALFMDRSINCLVAILAVLKIGAYYVPLDTDTPKNRVLYILKDCSIWTVLLDKKYISNFSALSGINCIAFDNQGLSKYSTVFDAADLNFDENNLAYCIYTSGSTGAPKGVAIHHKALMNYLSWAKNQYAADELKDFAFFTSLGFDLTITSIFLPLISGGTVHIYSSQHHDIPSIIQVLKDNKINFIKITPAHISYFSEFDLSKSKIKTIVIGGENLKATSARNLLASFPRLITIYNEYGPTEATVGCIVHRFDPELDINGSVPIGRPIKNVHALLLDDKLNPVETGKIGEICIAGDSLGKGYINNDALTGEKFIEMASQGNVRIYRTGDLAIAHDDGKMVFLGRKDEQVKLHGYRIEMSEIENVLLQHDEVKECVVSTLNYQYSITEDNIKFCKICGVSSSFPNTIFNQDSICNHCDAFNEYKTAIDDFFRSEEDLKNMVEDIKIINHPKYDCILALSGGKDSTYALCRLHDMGLRIFTFTLDNGFISDEAKMNINHTVNYLGLDHRYVATPHMNKILLDSFNRYSDACNGCFKTIYAYSINIAKEFGVNYIFTGLSRGQIFETRMSELLRSKKYDEKTFEKNLTAVRKIYHQVDDVVKQNLACDWSDDDDTFQKIKFIDFYRYCEVSRDELYDYIQKKADWKRPSDTGRSTNCLLNDVSIYVHGKERGYHKYELPYSWDVRMGHINRDDAIKELDDASEIDVEGARTVLNKIGYKIKEVSEKAAQATLVGYYLSDKKLDEYELKKFVASYLPEYMVPSRFLRLDKIPITPNAKINKKALPLPVKIRRHSDKNYEPPKNGIQKELVNIWKELLNIENVGINDNFFEIGGYSFSVLTLLLKINKKYEKSVSIEQFSKNPTISALSGCLVEA